MTSEPEFYTVDEVASRLRVTTVTVYNWISQKKLAAVKLSRRNFRIPKSEVDALIMSHLSTKEVYL